MCTCYRYVVPGTPTVAVQAVSLSGTKIIGVDGKEVQFRGLSYFGFENGNTAPDGIWQVGHAAAAGRLTVESGLG